MFILATDALITGNQSVMLKTPQAMYDLLRNENRLCLSFLVGDFDSQRFFHNWEGSPGKKARGIRKFGFEGGQTPLRRCLSKIFSKLDLKARGTHKFIPTFQQVGLVVMGHGGGTAASTCTWRFIRFCNRHVEVQQQLQQACGHVLTKYLQITNIGLEDMLC